ncbi:MAG: hypothetical protein ABR540_23330 [Acidimicrobiales bacterium]
MPTAAFVENKIAAIEGFAVRIRFAGPGRTKGRDVRGDRMDLPSYGYKRAASSAITVAAWIQNRFEPTFPGYAVDVLDGNERPVSGRTLLSTVRASYR